MSSRNTLALEVAQRLGDVAHGVWSLADLQSYTDFAIKSLYPTYFRYKVAMTTATVGPLQATPDGCSNLHAVGLQADGSTRVRRLRNWQEGDGNAYITKTGIDGDTLVWSWTAGWDAPDDGDEPLSVPWEAEDVIVMRAEVKALERLLNDRVSLERYFSLNVRQVSSEADIADAIDGLRNGINDAVDKALPLPDKYN